MPIEWEIRETFCSFGAGPDAPKGGSLSALAGLLDSNFQAPGYWLMLPGATPVGRRAEPPPSGVCAVTGSTGYVGSRVVRRLVSDGWKIRSLSRLPAPERDIDGHVHFELDGRLASEALAGADALVHMAYDFNVVRWRDVARVNIDGSRRLFAAARDAKVARILLISSVAAFPGARSHYGRAKLEIERAALEVNATIVRPGLVWGDQGAAAFGALQSAVRRWPLLPLPVPGGLELRMVHEDDLAALAAGILSQWPLGEGKLYVAAAERPTTFMELVHSLNAPTSGRRRFVRLPWRAPWLAMRTLEACGASLSLRSDSLVSLAKTDVDPLTRATDRVERYGVRFRPYSPSS